MTAIIVAIDGPAASGKSSTAQAVARGLAFRHLDSGALYRGVTLAALEAGLASPFPEADVVAAATTSGVRLEPRGRSFEVRLEGRAPGEALRGAGVTANVSAVAALPAVRSWVNARLREAAAAGEAVVVDGRDIGSVVFPEAQLKVFLTATPLARAVRRLRQRGDAEDDPALERETAMLAARDLADSSRDVAPLAQAADAVLLDTSDLSFEEQVDRIVALARDRGLA
jgi:cytidylate kinase